MTTKLSIHLKWFASKPYASQCRKKKKPPLPKGRGTALGEMEFFKVLEYETCGVAKVYYISKGKTGGNVLTFVYEEDTWHEVSCNTIWSKTGSADDVIYPYWWHRIY